MKTFYEKKAEFHHKEWCLAKDANKEKAAALHLAEYVNYMELIEQEKRRTGEA